VLLLDEDDVGAYIGDDDVALTAFEPSRCSMGRSSPTRKRSGKPGKIRALADRTRQHVPVASNVAT